MRRHLDDLLFSLGLACIVVGLGMAWLPLGIIALGAGLVFTGLQVARADASDSDSRGGN